jgi:hypothetical protein
MLRTRITLLRVRNSASPCCGSAIPHHLDVNEDPAFHFDAEPDPTFYFEADPDPAPRQSETYLALQRDFIKLLNCGRDLAEWLERLTFIAIVSTVLGSIIVSSDTVKFEG